MPSRIRATLYSKEIGRIYRGPKAILRCIKNHVGIFFPNHLLALKGPVARLEAVFKYVSSSLPVGVSLKITRVRRRKKKKKLTIRIGRMPQEARAGLRLLYRANDVTSAPTITSTPTEPPPPTTWVRYVF